MNQSFTLLLPLRAFTFTTLISWLLVGLLLTTSASGQIIRYVSTTGINSTPSSATSWLTSTTKLQEAIDYVASSPEGGTVCVASGVYKPGGSSNTNPYISFSMANNVTIIGGYEGVGSPGNRSSFPSSTLSGEIGDPSSTADNSLHVILHYFLGLNNTAVLDGFVIANGNASIGNSTNAKGGGMYNYGSSPAIANCIFQYNSSLLEGGGMENNNSNPSLTNCIFQYNSSSSIGGAIDNNNSNPILINCSFLNNMATFGGGAMCNSFNSNSILTNCSFQNNSTSSLAGLMFSYVDSSTILTNCVLFSNGEANTFINQYGASITVRYSLLEPSVTGFVDGGNNKKTAISPFISTTSTNIDACSPGINAGLNSASGLSGISTDLAGNPHIYGGAVDMGAYEFQGTSNAVSITNPTTNMATVGQAFSQSFSASGGTGPFSFSVYSGSLPTSLSLASTGILSGKPTESGSYTLVILAQNANSCRATGDVYNLTVASSPATTISGFAATSSTVCAGSPVTFTATVGNVSGSYAYTLTNGSSTTNSTTSSTSFSQSLVVSGSGTQSFSLVVSDNGLSSVASTSLTVGSHPDLQALTDLYNATNGSGWTNKTGWLTSCNPCGGWYGVTCSGGRVSGIILDNNQLSGSIPTSLTALTNLQNLTLRDNQLSGSIPTSLTALTNLKTLDLSDNLLTGSIPASLSALTNLQTLALSVNQLTGGIPTSLSVLTNLDQLIMGDNQLSGSIPASLSALTNLNYLTLAGNQLTGNIPSSLGSLTNLQYLLLSSNQLSGTIPSSLSALTKLQYLWLDNNQLSGCYPASLTALCGITKKFFSGNAGLPGGGSTDAFTAFCASGQGSDAFVATATASALTAGVGGVISLSTAGGSSYNWIAPAGAQLSGPATMSVVSASLTTAGVKTFTVVVSNGGTCSQTTTVSVTATAVIPTISGFAATSNTICAGNVASFTATVGNVSGSYAYTLTNASSSTSGTTSSTSFSTSLVVSGSGSQSFSLVVSDNGGSALAITTLTVGSHPDLQALTDLYNSTNGSGWTNKSGWLASCDPCTGNGGRSWYGVTCSGGRVTQLELGDNHLNGSIPSSLSALTNLTLLWLHGNQLSGSIPESLSALTHLATLYLHINQLSGSIPTSLTALTNLLALNLYNNQLDGGIPASLSALTNLEFLSLGRNQLSGSIPTSLSNLTHLATLDLNTNQLSGGIPASLSALTNLADLRLNNNSLSGSIPASIGALPKLTFLRLTSNQLSGCYPASLTALCGVTNWEFSDNAGLPGGGSNSAFAAFCASGRGSEAFVPTATASSPTINVGSVVSLSTSGGSAYRWSAPAGAQLSIPATASVVSASLTTAGVKTFTVVVSQGGSCSQTAMVSVTATAVVPAVSGFAATSSIACVGSVATFTATVGNVSGSYTYTLTNGSSTTTGTTSNTALNMSLVMSGSGSQSFSLVVSDNGQSTTAATSLLVSTPPTASLQASGTITCATTSIILTAGGGTTYNFSGTGLVSQNPTSGTAVVNAAGLYSVTVTSPGGCSSTATTSVSSNTTAPSVSINPSSTTLTNASPAVSLTAVGTGTLLWSTGATTQVISVSTSGTYSVTLTSPNGCTASASVPVIGSDLTVTLELPQANFASSGTAAVGNFLINVFEVAGLPTSSGNVTITITAPVGYTLTFVSSLTSTNVSGGEHNPVVVNNPQWTVTHSLVGRQLTLTMNSGAFIGGGGESSLGFSITRTTANSGSSANITVNVVDDLTMSYDGNLSNNVYARVISGL